MEQLDLFLLRDTSSTPRPAPRPSRRSEPKEWKLVALRDCPLPSEMYLCDSPQRAADYWRSHIEGQPIYDPERECLVVLLLNTRRRIRGHHLVTVGTMDTLLVHPREVFRIAIAANASAVILLHNHPTGEPHPSEADIRVTRDIMRAGQILKIELLDHIIGRPGHVSLKEMGYLYGP